jgi:hypothetical protein
VLTYIHPAFAWHPAWLACSIGPECNATGEYDQNIAGVSQWGKHWIIGFRSNPSHWRWRQNCFMLYEAVKSVNHMVHDLRLQRYNRGYSTFYLFRLLICSAFNQLYELGLYFNFSLTLGISHISVKRITFYILHLRENVVQWPHIHGPPTWKIWSSHIFATNSNFRNVKMCWYLFFALHINKSANLLLDSEYVYFLSIFFWDFTMPFVPIVMMMCSPWRWRQRARLTGW